MTTSTVFRTAGLALFIIAIVAACSQKSPRITGENLLKIIDRPDVVVIDVRLEGVWMRENSKIQGAMREDPEDVDSWMHKYPKNKTIVFYCS